MSHTYISKDPNLILYGPDGTPKVFFKNGLYTGTIDAYDETNSAYTLMPLRSTDLAGNALGETGFIPEEAAGLGSLNGKTNSSYVTGDWAGGSTISPTYFGLSGLFFVLPNTAIEITPVTGYLATFLGCFENAGPGDLVYRGVTYAEGETIKVRDIATGTTGTIYTSSATVTGSITVDVPNCCRAECDCQSNLTEAFKIAHLMYGDEPANYYVFNENGYVGRSESGADIGEGLGYMRP